MSSLAEGYDVVLFDLDGVLYLGPQPVAGAVDGMRRLVETGARVAYVTNNAARPVEVVASHLASLGFPATPDDVISSAQAAVALMCEELPAGASVLVAGTQNLVDMVAEAGFRVVSQADEHPRAIVQGYDPGMTWARLDQAALAVQNGAAWYAANTDSTRPTEHGLVPGAGVGVYAVQVTTTRTPTVTGKPFRPLMDAALERTQARRALFIGDRLDTDIAGANTVGIDSALVFTGVHGKTDLLTAPPELRPTTIIADLLDLVRPARVAVLGEDTATVNGVTVGARDGVAHLVAGSIGDQASQLDALWALAQLVWRGIVRDFGALQGDLNAVH